MVSNNMNRFHTGGNVALFEFFARPYSMNAHKPYTYDYNDCTAEKDLTSYNKICTIVCTWLDNKFY